MRGNVLAGPKSPLWSCRNWDSRICCRECGKVCSSTHRECCTCRSTVKWWWWRGGTKSKGDDLAEFKRELLAEVRSTIKGASVVPLGPTSRRSSTVELDDSKGSDWQSTTLGFGDPGEDAEARPRRSHETVRRAGEPSTTGTVAHENPGWPTSRRPPTPERVG